MSALEERPNWIDDPRAVDTVRQGFYLHRANEDRTCLYGKPGDFCVHVWNSARRWDSATVSATADGVVVVDTDPHGLLTHSLEDLGRAIEAVRTHLANRAEGPDSGERSRDEACLSEPISCDE